MLSLMYIVEDITGNITDMFSFQIPVANKTPPLTKNVLTIVNTIWSFGRMF